MSKWTVFDIWRDISEGVNSYPPLLSLYATRNEYIITVDSCALDCRMTADDTLSKTELQVLLVTGPCLELCLMYMYRGGG